MAHVGTSRVDDEVGEALDDANRMTVVVGAETKMAMLQSSVAFSVRVRHLGDEAESGGDT